MAFNPMKYTAPATIAAGLLIILFAQEYRAQRAFAVFIWFVGAIFGVLWAMPKLLPLQGVLASNLLEFSGREARGYESFSEIFSTISGTSALNHHSFGVGILAFLLALVGIVPGWRRTGGWVLLLLFSVLFSLGPNAPYPLSIILSRVPLVQDLGKYANIFILTPVCMLAAEGLHRLHLISCEVFRSKIVGTTIVSVLSVSALVLPLSSTLKIFDRTFPIEEPRFVQGKFYQVAYSPFVGVIDAYREPPKEFLEASQYHNIRRGIGTITWYGNFVFKERAVPKIFVESDGGLRTNERYRGEIFLVGERASSGSVTALKVSYNSLKFRYYSTTPQRVVLNFNFDENWTSTVGHVVNQDGLLAVDLGPTSPREVVLSFRNRSFSTGLWIAIISVPFYFAVVLQLRRRARRGFSPNST